MLSLNSMEISYSSAHSNMQATNIYVRQKLKIFWVVPGMPEANAWLSGEVLKKNKGSGLYTVQLRPYDDGKPVIRLMDLQNKHMRPFIRYESDEQYGADDDDTVETEENDDTVASWLACESCGKWHELPIKMNFKDFECNPEFTCQSAIWDKSGTKCDLTEGGAATSSQPLSLYERERSRNVKRNHEFLRQLMPEKFSFEQGTPKISPKKKKKTQKQYHTEEGARKSNRPTQKANPKWEPADFRIKKKINRRRDCPIIFEGVLKDGPFVQVKGKTLLIEWSMEDTRSAVGAYIYLCHKHNKVDDIYIVSEKLDVTAAKRGSFLFPIPLDIAAGRGYFIEIGNSKPECFGMSPLFSIEDPVGLLLESDVGVWCTCGSTKHYVGKKGYRGAWITCSTCNSWQHEDCYSAAMLTQHEFQCYFCHTDALIRDTTKEPETAEENSIQSKGKRATRRSLFSAICPTKQREMLTVMLGMISATARYRRMSKKLCSTPDHVAVFLKQVLDTYGMTATGQKIIDLGAGHGQLSKNLPANTIAVEKETNRCDKGRRRAPLATWINEDIFGNSFLDYAIEHRGSFDIVVSNPDFEIALQSIFVGLFLLKPNSKLFFLLPSDFFEASPARTRVYKILNCHIEKEYKLGHLAFYEDDRTAEKLSTDSIFVLAHGRCSKYEYTVMNSRLGGQLRCSAPTARSKWSEEVLGDMCEKLELPIDTPRKKILQAWMEALDAADKEADGHVHE